MEWVRELAENRIYFSLLVFSFELTLVMNTKFFQVGLLKSFSLEPSVGSPFGLGAGDV